MALAEVGRFAELSEAHVAASLLRSSGMPVLIQNEHWGSADYAMTNAMGGFRLWVPETEARDVRAYLATLRPRAEAMKATPEAIASGALGLLVGAALGPRAALLIAWRRGAVVRWSLTAGLAVLALVCLVSIALALSSTHILRNAY